MGAGQKEDVMISVGVELRKAAAAIDGFKRQIQSFNTFKQIGTHIASSLDTANAKTQAFGKSLASSLEAKGIKDVDAAFQSVMNSGNMLQKQSPQFFKPIDEMLPKVTKKVKNYTGQILGAGLGTMFFGMAIQRMFMGIWKSATKTFTDVMKSTDDATNGFTMLEGSMKFLGFTAGQALEPLAMALIPLVMQIANWIEQNPKLFQQLVKWGIIIGTVLMVVGQLGTGIFGLVQAGGLLKAVFVGLKGLKLAAFGKTLMAVFMSPVTWIILLIAGLVMVGIWIFKMGKEMGGAGEFMKSVLRGVLRIVFLLGEGLIWLGSQILDGMIDKLNFIIGLINAVIRGSNNLLGTDIGELSVVKNIDMQFGEGILGNYLEWEQEKLGPKNGYATGNEGDPMYSAPKTVAINTVNVQTNNAEELLETLQRYSE
jgi:hypothetical protein